MEEKDLAGQVQAAKAELARVFAAWETASAAERFARKAYHRASAALGDAERRLRQAHPEPRPADRPGEDIYERARRLRDQPPGDPA